MLRAPYVIVGIGLAGCVALAWMAHSLQQHAKNARPAAPGRAPASAFADRLDGPLAAHEEHDAAGLRRVLTGRAAPGQDRAALARAIAESACRDAGGAVAVVVTLRGAAGEAPCTVELPMSAAAPR